MLQFALLLLGCALSLYLWEVDVTVTLVVLGVTSFSVASYAFFVVAGSASSSCPYQTPGANILRHISSLARSALHSASSHSRVVREVSRGWYWIRTRFDYSRRRLVELSVATLLSPFMLLANLVHDAYLLAQATIRAFVVNTPRVCRWFHRACGRDPQIAA